MATQPEPETPAPSEPAQPIQPPPEIVTPTPDIDQPASSPMPSDAPGQPMG